MESAPPSLATRLNTGGPLLFGVDPRSALGVGGPQLSVLARTRPEVVLDLHAREVSAGADVVLALTADSTTRALHELGMAFRAAAVTGAAVELAARAAEETDRGVVVGGVLGGDWAQTLCEGRLSEEMSAHAARLAAAGVGVIVARGPGIVAACATGLPTYARVELGAAPDAGSIQDTARRSLGAGADALLFDIAHEDAGLTALRDVHLLAPRARVGFFLGASGLAPAAWVRAARRLLDAGAWSLGGGHGATPSHLEALATDLGRIAPHSKVG